MKAFHSRRGGILSGLLLTALAIAILGILAASWVVHNVRVRTVERADGGDVSIDIPGGHFRVRGRDNVDARALGVPVYPGAKRGKDGGGATFEWTSSDGKDEKDIAVAGGELFTPDPVSKVADWYRERLPGWLIVTERDGSVRMEFKESGQKRMVAIREKGDGTHIGVASVGEPASN
jgi:hypothetical protein